MADAQPPRTPPRKPDAAPANGSKPRLGKARKRAKVAIKSAKRLIKKHGNKIDPARTAEVQQALDRLVEANSGKDVVAIYDAMKALDDYSELYLGEFRKSPTREYIESIGLAVGIALLLRAFVIEAFTIPSGSMIPTLAVGDFLFVNKLSYGMRLPFTDNLLTQWSAPERGDVIVFMYPCDKSLDYIKRVVALPGDIIHESGQFGTITVNGEPIAERDMGVFENHLDFVGVLPGLRGELWNEYGAQPGCQPHRYETQLGDQKFAVQHCNIVEHSPIAGESTPADWSNVPSKSYCATGGKTRVPIQFPWKVPEDHVFVMGDNRENSADGRYWGFVPYGSIKGKAMFIWLSWDSAKPWSRFWEKIRWDRLFGGVHADPE